MQKRKALLDGFCAEPKQEDRIAVRADGRIVFLRLADIDWAEPVDDCVELRVGPESYLLHQTLASIAARLPADRFRHLNRRRIANRQRAKEFNGVFHRDHDVPLHNSTRPILVCRYRFKRTDSCRL